MPASPLTNATRPGMHLLEQLRQPSQRFAAFKQPEHARDSGLLCARSWGRAVVDAGLHHSGCVA